MNHAYSYEDMKYDNFDYSLCQSAPGIFHKVHHICDDAALLQREIGEGAQSQEFSTIVQTISLGSMNGAMPC